MNNNISLEKEAMKQRIRESMYKSVKDDGTVDKFMGRRPKTFEARKNQIYKLVKKYGIDSRLYSDETWKAIDDYKSVISSLGCDVDIRPCANLGSLRDESDGGYTDYDPTDNMPRSKQYKIVITFEDGMCMEGYIKCMAAGTVQDPFSKYDTCLVLWSKPRRELSNESKAPKHFRMRESTLHSIIKESVSQTLRAIKKRRF